MARYDAIRGAGNVTVQAPPDFWTSAKQSFDDDYDRLVAAQDKKKAEERYNSETAKEESRYNETTSTERRRYLEQQEQIKKSKDREDWQYMYEGVKTDAQRAIIYENGLKNEVSGLTPSGFTAITESAATEKSLNQDSQNYYAGNDEYKSLNGAKLEANLIKNNKHTQAALVTKSLKEARKNVENKEVIEMISAQYGDVFSPQLKTFFETTGDVSDAQLNMGVEMMKTSQAYKLKSMQEKFDLAKSLMDMQTKGEFPTQGQINTVARANMMGYNLYEELTSVGGDEDEDDLSALPKPSLENLDEILTGRGNSYDALNQKRKLAIFNNVVEKHAANWGEMDREEKIAAGKKIEDEINKSKYDIEQPETASFGGVRIIDPEYPGTESITNEMIESKVEEIMQKKGFTTEKKKSYISKSQMKEFRKQALSTLKKEMIKESKSKLSKVKVESFYDPDYVGGA